MKDEKTALQFDSELLDEEFDPLEDLEPDEDDESGEFIGYVGEPSEDDQTSEADVRPAKERIEELLARMAPRRKVLIGTINFCREKQTVAAVNEFIDELQVDNYSVYSPATLCSLLEKAGALIRITPEGKSADEVEAEPRVVVIDGVEYLEAAEPLEVCWLSSEEGIEVAEADKPLERLHELFQQDTIYLPIYKRILTLCANEGGATTPQINEAVDHDPLVQKPRLYAPHFVDKLEKCDALVWKKSWMITDVGETGLEELADIDDPQPTIDNEGA